MSIDLADPATKYAKVEASKRYFKNRLPSIEGDVRQRGYRDEFAHVDILRCFTMGHDSWPRGKCVVTLQRSQKAFPKARRFLVGDTNKILINNTQSKCAVAEDNVPIFTLWFDLGRAMMGVYLPKMEDWEEVFVEGGWRCVRRLLIETQSLSIIFDLGRLQ